jgi:endonuclease/exonuclease/phosphatase family metal-dependent hydrolase
MKLVSINIENNLHNETVLEFLKKEQPDVVCFQEFLEEDLELFKKELNFDSVYQTLSYIMDHKNYPHLMERKEGLIIFAKKIVNSGSIFYLGGEEKLLKPFDLYSPGTDYQENRALIWVDVRNKEGEIYRFITTHFPVTEKGISTPYQLEVLDLMLEQLDKLGEFVLCGDLNAPRGNETFNRLAKKYKDNIPLEYKTSIDQNLHRVRGIQLMVDGLFTTPIYKTSNVRLVDGVSDHMAIVAEVNKN